VRVSTLRRIFRPRKLSSFNLVQFDLFLAKVQLSLLFAAIIVVPLVVLPESNFVDITSTPKTTILRMLGTLQAGILLSRLILAFTATEQNYLGQSLRSIRSNRPVFAILGSVAAIALISIISASQSILPHQSWWGRVPAGFESGAFTGLMYVVMSISAFITIREFSASRTFWRTLAAVGFLATLVGFFQFLGWSPLDISSTHNSKLTGTNGNPIFFGAMLVPLSPITIGVLISEYRSSSKRFRLGWLPAIALASLLVTISLVATGSRGPMLGMLAGGVLATVLILSFRQIKSNALPVAIALIFGLTGALTAALIDPTPPVSGNSPAEVGLGDVDDSIKNSIFSSGLDNLTRTNTFDLRRRYWKLSTEISFDRDPVPHTNDAPKAVRLLFGYGPDMFRFAGTYFADNTTFTRRLTAAHNDPINRLVEQGLLGFIAWIALWISLAYGLLVLFNRHRSTLGDPTSWIVIAITAALTGRFIEQLFGSPTTAGVLVFWVSVGGLAAMLMRPSQQPAGQSRAAATPSNSFITQFATYAGVLIIILGSIVLAWDRGANYLIATQVASFQYRSTVITAQEAIERLEIATKIAPDVSRYWHDLAEIVPVSGRRNGKSTD